MKFRIISSILAILILILLAALIGSGESNAGSEEQVIEEIQ